MTSSQPLISRNHWDQYQYILKISKNFFSDKLADIINLSFRTGIFPDLCKLAKVIPIFKDNVV